MNVLLLPDTATAERVAEWLVGWSAGSLLRPFCIWTAGGAPSAPVRQVIGGEVTEMPLGDALAAARPEEIAFVAVYPAAAGDEIEAGFADQVDGFLAWARREVLAVDAEKPLSCALAVVPSSIDSPVPRQLFKASWANFLVAPEDRASPDAVNQLHGDAETDEDRFLRHAAHAAAAAAAFWKAPEAQRPESLARLEERLGPRSVEVRLMRSFSRIVELGHLPDHVAAAVFEPRGGWPRPARDLVRSSDPEAVVGAAARLFLGKHRSVLDRRPFEPILELPFEEKLGLLDALRALYDQVRRFVLRLPFQLMEEAAATIHDRAAERIEALSRSTGRIRVKRWEEQPEGERGLAQLPELLDEEKMVTEDGVVRPAWVDLRQTVLGLVDGSPLPAEISPAAEDSGGTQVIVSDSRYLTRDPLLLEEDGGEAGDGGDDPEVSPPLLQQIRLAIEASIAAADARAAALAEPEPDVEDEHDSPDPDPEHKWWRRGGWIVALIRRALLHGFLALVAIVAVLVLLPLLAALAASVAIVIACFVSIALLARRVLLQPRLQQSPEALQELGELNRSLERIQALGDGRRLRRRLRELDSWTAILGELVYRPWVRDSFEEIELVDTIDAEQLPRACSVAVARTDAELLAQIGARTRAQTFKVGWLSTIYRTVEELAMEEYELRYGVAPQDPAADTTADGGNGRAALHEAILRGEGRRRFDNPIAVELLEVIGETKIDELAPAVVPVSPRDRPLAPTATWILPPPGVAGAIARLGGRLVGIRGWSATATMIADGLAVTAASAIDGVLGVTGADGDVIPVTGISVLSESGLGLLHFDGNGGPPEGGGQLAQPRKGDGVVSCEAAPGGDATRWGFVAADRQLSFIYEGGTPGHGAPVFDLEGNLLAVHGERGEVLPLPELEELLAAEREEPRPLANGAGPAAVAMPATEFVAAIADGAGVSALQPAYWARRDGTHEVDRTLPLGLARLDVGGPLRALAGNPEYLRPLRVMVHRIELSHAVEPGELVFCAE